MSLYGGATVMYMNIPEYFVFIEPSMRNKLVRNSFTFHNIMMNSVFNLTFLHSHHTA